MIVGQCSLRSKWVVLTLDPRQFVGVLVGRKTSHRLRFEPMQNAIWAMEICCDHCAAMMAADRLDVRPRRLQVVNRVESVVLGEIDEDEARREGFESAGDFVDDWTRRFGRFDPTEIVWRAEWLPLPSPYSANLRPM